MLGAIMLANLFGELAVLVRELNEKQAKQQKKVDIAKTVMKHIDYPVHQQDKIISFLTNTAESLYFFK